MKVPWSIKLSLGNFKKIISLYKYFFSSVFFNWFQLFCCGFFSLKSSRTHSEQVKNDLLEKGCRWFQLFFIDFQLFYFLSRIIPAYNNENTIANFPWGEYKDWSTHGTWYSPRPPWVDQSLYSLKLEVINCFIIWH